MSIVCTGIFGFGSSMTVTTSLISSLSVLLLINSFVATPLMVELLELDFTVSISEEFPTSLVFVFSGVAGDFKLANRSLLLTDSGSFFFRLKWLFLRLDDCSYDCHFVVHSFAGYSFEV